MSDYDVDHVIAGLEDDIVTLEAALEAYRWIPVGERLPDRPPSPLAYSDSVLSYSKTGRVRVDKYVHKRNSWLSGRKDVTHWQEIILPGD